MEERREGRKEKRKIEAKHCVDGMHCVPISSALGHSVLEGGRKTLKLQRK